MKYLLRHQLKLPRVEVIDLFIYKPRLVFNPAPDISKYDISRVEFKMTPLSHCIAKTAVHSTPDILLSLYGEGRSNISSFIRDIVKRFKTLNIYVKFIK